MKDRNICTYFPFTPIANNFIKGYMIKASPIFSVIYIFLLQKTMAQEQILISNVAEELEILQSDLIKALNYWKEQGILQFEIEEDLLILQFINKTEESKPKVIIQRDKSYTDDEISMYSKQDEIQQLFRIVENKFAKTLSYQDKKKIIEIFDGYGISMEMFVILITYCKDKGKSNFNYIEKVAIDWAENGIDSPEKVESYINLFERDYKKIMNIFGLIGQEMSPTHINFMKKWINELKMPMEVIEEACIKTISTLDRPSFKYADKILENWKKENIDTIEKVRINDEKFKAGKQLMESKYKSTEINNSKNNPQFIEKKNKFVNFEQPKIDFKKLRELEIKALKGEI